MEKLNAHFEAGPERLARFVIPRVDDAAPHVFPLGRRLLRAGRFLDVDREFRFGSAQGQ